MSIVKKARELCSYFDALLVIFDRIDIAKLAEADGVVLNNDTISPIDAKKLVEDGMLIGYEYFLDNTSVDLQDKNIDFVVAKSEINISNKKLFII